MRVLGVHDGHNASICYLVDGRVVFAVQEERLSRRKNHWGFPFKSIEYLLEKHHVVPGDVDWVVLNGLDMPPNPGLGVQEHFKRHQQLSVSAFARKFLGQYTPLGRITRGMRRDERVKPLKKYGFREDRFRFVEHHHAHACSAYYGSPWWNRDMPVLVLTLDGGGDGLCATVSVGRKGRLQRISQSNDLDSLGNVYSRVTFMLGFTPWEHEYKLMGMAPYVQPQYGRGMYELCKGYLWLDGDGGLVFKRNILEPTGLMYNRLRGDTEFMRFDAICRGLQDYTEELILRWVENAVRLTNVHTVCLGGGVFMNVKVNKRIMELPGVERLFVFPSCGDESNVFGCVWDVCVQDQVEHGVEPSLPLLEALYFGPDLEDVGEKVRLFSKGHDVVVGEYGDVDKRVGEYLADGRIVARCCGRLEFGARALGNRSILVDAGDLRNVQVVNMMVKKRDFWMPFAPVLLDGWSDRYIVNPKGVDGSYMIMSFDTTERRGDIVGAVHQADGTVRPQIVRRGWNPGYFDAVDVFCGLRGVGGVMNTSFNVHGFPIVDGVDVALKVFWDSGLKVLQVDNFIIEKKIR